MEIENYEYTTKTKYNETFFRFSKSFKTFDELKNWATEKDILIPERNALMEEWEQYKPQGRKTDHYIIDKYNDDQINIISRYCPVTMTYQIYGFQKI